MNKESHPRPPRPLWGRGIKGEGVREYIKTNKCCTSSVATGELRQVVSQILSAKWNMKLIKVSPRAKSRGGMETS